MMHSFAGRELGRYSALEPIERGRAVESYWSFDQEHRRPVVLKVIPRRVIAESRASEALEAEVRLLQRMQHPAIESVLGIERAADSAFLVAECLPGLTLAERLPALPGNESESYRLGLPLARAIEHAHAHGVVHGAIAPRTVLLSPEDLPRLIDFGVARRVAGIAPFLAPGDGPVAAMLRETVPYLSPEQLLGAEAGPRSDLYSLGVLLHELAIGRRPFASKLTTVLIAEIVRGRPLPRTDRPRPPASRFARILEGCLAADPHHRFDSAADLVRALERMA